MELDRFLSENLGNFRDRRKPLRERPQVEAGTADKNSQSTGTCCGDDFVERERAPVGGGTALAGIEEAIEPVRYPPFGRFVGPRSQDAEIAITLQAVSIDDRAAKGVR